MLHVHTSSHILHHDLYCMRDNVIAEVRHLDLLVDAIAGDEALVEVDEEGEPAEQRQQALWCVPCRVGLCIYA